MDHPCHHHPDREAAGTCCYCDRSLCEECLLTNRQEKSFCRREDDCLAYQDDRSSPGEPTSPIVDYLIDQSSLDTQVKRVSEILEELEELKVLLEDLEGNGQPLEIDLRIPGFCAHKLTEEAAALLDLISLRVEFIRKEQELSGSSVLLERTNEVQGFLEQDAGPKIREYQNWTKQYGSADVSALLAALGRQDQEENP